MSAIYRDAVLAALRTLKAPDVVEGCDQPNDIVSAGLVSEIFIANGKVFFSIIMGGPDKDLSQHSVYEELRLAAHNIVMDLPGVQAVMVSLTAERPIGASIATKEEKVLGHKKRAPTKASLAGVKHIIAIASGKGGVGKSTMALNVALALKARGLAVGLMDADIYGPSLPRLCGLVDKKPYLRKDERFNPLEAFGLKLMSMGFLVEEKEPIIWRGPMVMGAIGQLLHGVQWAPLDILIVDMPPGTGDAQLSLVQKVPLSGAIIVSTPQDLALVDAFKAVAMFGKMGVPLLGLIENMSYFIAPDTGKRYDIFGAGGAEAAAQTHSIPFLGAVPLDPALREGADLGTPLILRESHSFQAQLYAHIAEQLAVVLNL